MTKSIVEIPKQPSSAQSEKIVTFDLQGAALGENDDEDGGTEEVVPCGRGSEDDEKAVDQGGNHLLAMPQRNGWSCLVLRGFN